MSRQPLRRNTPLSVDAIVDAACAIIDESGLRGLSMRRLGEALGVDPMAVYHHVGDKRRLLAQVMARVVGGMAVPEATNATWETRVRGWATAYWDVVVANRELIAAGLADPVIAEGGLPHLVPLTDAIAESGITPTLVEPNAWLVVDFVHGAALGAAAPRRHGKDELDPLRRAFQLGLDTIITGITGIAGLSGVDGVSGVCGNGLGG
jgi:AcrR family transcriptional regulator